MIALSEGSRRQRWMCMMAVGSVLSPSQIARACPLMDIPSHLTQSDGTVVPCLLSGDELHNYAHDSHGFVIVQDGASGNWVYARKERGRLLPTNLLAGRADPGSPALAPGLMPDAPAIDRLRGTRARSERGPRIRHTGNLNNLVVFVRFADDTEFPENASVFEALLNGPPGTVSMRNYFLEASYGKLKVTSWLVASSATGTIVSYQDSQPRAYYLPYNAVSNPIGYQDYSDARETALVSNALTAIKGQLPTGVNLDADGDGVADHVTLIVRGDAAPNSAILWPHFAPTAPPFVTLGSLRAGPYDIQIENVLLPNYVGAVCHEFGHALGAPDLYHYNYNGIDPVGVWDLMGAPARSPQHMCAYVKWKYMGWLDSVPEILLSGHYSLLPLTSQSGNCWKIISPNSGLEYYVVEYRHASGLFESSLPASGLLVYRVIANAGAGAQGNSYGPPDEIYVYRPGGTTTANGTLSQAPFSIDSGRTVINDTTDPSGFLSTGANGGLNISNVSAAGETITFDPAFPYNLYHLAFTVQPGDGKPGQVLLATPSVGVLSRYGIAPAESGTPIHLELDPAGGAPNAKLAGGTTAATVNAVASFPDLAVDTFGTCFILRASSPGMQDGLSQPFSTADNGISATTRVSVATGGVQSNGAATYAAINSDGSMVSFVDYGTNLGVGDHNAVQLHDVAHNETACESFSDDGNPIGVSPATHGMSPDGRFIVYSSISLGQSPQYSQVYLRDAVAGSIQLISKAPDGTRANKSCSQPSVSADGRYVAFASTASNLVSGATLSHSNVYVCDTQTGALSCASLTSAGGFPNGDSTAPAISADGHFVAFASSAADIVPGSGMHQIYIRNLTTGTTLCVTRRANGTSANPSISADGRYVAFDSVGSSFISGVPSGVTEVYRWDALTGRVDCVSVDTLGKPCSASSYSPSLSLDGSRVAFVTKTALSPCTGSKMCGYVRDMNVGRTVLATRTTAGTPADGDTAQCALSGDGRWAAFITTADNLVHNDTNGCADAFRFGPLDFGPITLSDVISALRIAGGLSTASGDEAARLESIGGAGAVSISDALGIVRVLRRW